MIDEIVINALSNLPFAVVLVVYLYLDFKQRGATIAAMQQMVHSFTEALRDCCEDVS